MDAEILLNELEHLESINSEFQDYESNMHDQFDALLQIFGISSADLDDFSQGNGIKGVEQDAIDAKNEIYLMFNKYHDISTLNLSKLEETQNLIDTIAKEEENALHLIDLARTINDTEMDYFRFLSYSDPNKPYRLPASDKSPKAENKSKKENDSSKDISNFKSLQNPPTKGKNKLNFEFNNQTSKQKGQSPQSNINQPQVGRDVAPSGITISRPSTAKGNSIVISTNQNGSNKQAPNQMGSGQINVSIPITRNTPTIEKRNSSKKLLFDKKT